MPATVSDLAAIQRGGRLIVQFTVPTRTTEGHPIPPPLTLDLRAGTADQFDENQWAASARQIPPAANVGGCDTKAAQPCPTARYEFPSADWTGKEVILGVRAAAGNGKQSAWSNFVIVPVVPAPAKARQCRRRPPRSREYTWRGSARGTDFRVFRKTGDAPLRTGSQVTTPRVDRHCHRIRHALHLRGSDHRQAGQSAKKRESDLSDAVSITPRDTFPPAAPKGLQGSDRAHLDRTHLGSGIRKTTWRATASTAPRAVARWRKSPTSPPSRAIRTARWNTARRTAMRSAQWTGGEREPALRARD